MSLTAPYYHVLITYDQTAELLEALKNPNYFDGYAYHALRAKANVSHNDAMKFANHFRLTESIDGKPVSMDEDYLITAIGRHCVTVNELLEFDGILEDFAEYDSVKEVRRDEYLAARCGGVSHKLAKRLGKFY